MALVPVRNRDDKLVALVFKKGTKYTFYDLKSKNSIEKLLPELQSMNMKDAQRLLALNYNKEISFVGTNPLSIVKRYLDQDYDPNLIFELFPAFKDVDLSRYYSGKIEGFPIYGVIQYPDKLKDALKKVNKILKKHNLAEDLVGSILKMGVSTGLKTTLAQYYREGDIIGLSYKLLEKDVDTIVADIIHELGHKKWYYLDSKYQKRITRMYEDTFDKVVNSVKVGDIVKEKGSSDKYKRTYKVDKVRLSKRDYIVLDLKYLSSGVDNDLMVGQIVTMNFVNAFNNLYDENWKKLVLPVYAVSDYSMTSHKEFYSEVFKDALTKNKPELVDFIYINMGRKPLSMTESLNILL